MEQNKFEKQVKQKLDEFKIPPSENAWLNIENRIEKKGRRRFFIIFLVSLFLFTGGYWLFNSQNNIELKQNQHLNNMVKNDSEKATIKKNDSILNQPLITDKNTTGTIAFENTVVPGTSKILVVKNIASNHQKIRNKVNSFKRSRIKSKIENAISSEFVKNKKQFVEKDMDSKMNQNVFHIKKTDLAKLEEGEIDANIEQSAIEKVVAGTVSAVSSIKKHLTETDTSIFVANSKIPVNSNHKNKWVLGFTFSGGTSIVGNDPIGIYNNSSSNSSNQNTGGGIPFPYMLPAPIKNSIAFIGGVLVEKNIFGKSKINLGINYNYFSVMNKVGSKIDTSITAYTTIDSSAIAYISGNSLNNHRNHFNYIELPVSLKLRLSHTNSIPVFWKIGISISQLISSNALQFNNNSSIYYSDNSLFKKTQLGLSTGVSVTIFSNQKYPLSIGPSFYYGTSKLANEGLYKDKHFSYIGISTEILFGKK